jgi:hypothetical protein
MAGMDKKRIIRNVEVNEARISSSFPEAICAEKVGREAIEMD